jgi:hypothetical protein
MRFRPKKVESFPPGARLFNPGRDGISQGLLGQWCACRMAAEFRVRGWKRDIISRALELGSLFHLLLHRLYEQSMKKGAWTPNAALSAVVQEWQKRARKSGDEMQAVEDDLAVANRLFAGYAKRWYKSDVKREWIQLEQVFKQICNLFLLRGRVDGVFRCKGRLWLFETKTKKYVDDAALTAALQFDWQSFFYAMAKEVEIGEPIVGVLYNVIRKPSLELGKDGDRRAWYGRIEADIAKRPDWYFKRYEVRWTDAQRAIFREEFRQKACDFLAWAEGRLPTYRNQSECTGKWNCSYLAACASRSMVGYKRESVFRYPELEEDDK